jgi:hypothetical protein
MDRIEIPLSKTKITVMLIGTLVFVTLGILFLVTPDTFISVIFRNILVIRIVGVVAVIFFGAVGIYGLRKLFDKTVGLTIDEKGILDNSNASSVGLIDWNDIIEIKTEQVMSTKFLLIVTNDPDKYMDRVNGFKRKLLQGNMKMYGTPLSINANTLSHDFVELEKLIKERLIEHRENVPKR